MNFEIVTCEGPCGRELPRTSKHFRLDNRNGTYRRICKQCEALLKQQARTDTLLRRGHTKIWPMLYTTQLRSQLFPTRSSVHALPVHTLLAIMRLQRTSDYITQVPFRMPEAEELEHFSCWDDWLKSLAFEDQARTPLLVRIVGGRQGKWVRGNVVFVNMPCGEVIERFGGLFNARDLCRLLADADIPAAQASMIDEEVIRLTDELYRSKKV